MRHSASRPWRLLQEEAVDSHALSFLLGRALKEEAQREESREGGGEGAEEGEGDEGGEEEEVMRARHANVVADLPLS